MLISIDDYLNGDKEKNSDRVINQVKEGLHTCSELIVWISSIKSRYVISRTLKILLFCLIFGSLAFGINLFSVDVITDIVVNFEWRFYAYANFSQLFPCKNLNGTKTIEMAIVDIMKNVGTQQIA